jgi:MFS family permease
MSVASERRMAGGELCTGLVFGVLGMGLAGWAPRLPDVKSQLGLSDAELGGALLAVAAGSMLFMPVTGSLIGRFGCRRVLLGASVAFSLALVLPALAEGMTGLMIALFVLGAALGCLDVSANAQAAALERATGKQIMGKCHGTYSIGAIAGAIAGGVAAQAGMSVFLHLLILGLVLAVTSLLLLQGIPADEPAGLSDSENEPSPGALVLPSAAVWGLGAVAFCALMVEGAMLDWSAVYLREHVSAGPFLAGAGFALFSAGMAAGRLICDRIAEVRGRLFIVRTGAVVAAVSMALSLIQTNPVLATLGFVAFGFGLSGILPVMFSIAGTGKAGMPPGAAIAALATTAYTGLLIGPALIGMIAGLVGLPSSLVLLPILMLVIALGAGSLPIIRAPGPQQQGSRTC